MADWTLTAEGTTTGTVVTVLNSGNGGDPVSLVSGTTMTYSANNVLFGTKSIRTVGVDGTAVLLRWAQTDPTLRVDAYFYLNMPATVSTATILSFRNSSGNVASLQVNTSGNVAFVDGSSVGETFGTGLASGWYRFSASVTRGTTTSNGTMTATLRSVNASTKAETVIGSPYSSSVRNTGTTSLASVQWGKVIAAATMTVDWNILRMGTGSGADFAAYTEGLVRLTDPVITVVDTTTPTSTGGSNGTITMTWGAVSNAVRYEVTIVSGTVTSGFVATSSNAVSPHTFTGLVAASYTVAVRAIAGT